MNHNNPLLSGLQAILAVLSLGLLLAGLAFWLAGAPEIWLEIALRSGLSACCAAAALTGAFLLCGGLNRRRGQAEWRMARRGLGDYLFPASAALLCLMSSVLILPHWREAWQMFLAGEMVFQLLCPWQAGVFRPRRPAGLPPAGQTCGNPLASGEENRPGTAKGISCAEN